MQVASWPSEARSDDESVLTYDSSVTAISNGHLGVEGRTLHRYVSDPHLTLPVSPGGYRSDARHQLRLPLQQKQQDFTASRLKKDPLPSPTSEGAGRLQHDRHSSSFTSISDRHLRVFPMPTPRRSNGTLRSSASKDSMTPELEFGDSASPRQEDVMEAAWEDASCIDGASPRMEHSDRLAGLAKSLEEDQERVEDRFEVDALRRQVEQLQMALQLQSKQRELEQQLAMSDSHHLQHHLQQQQHLRRRPSQLQQQQQQRARMSAFPEDWVSPLTLPPTPQAPAPSMKRPLPTSVHPAGLRASLLNPSHSSAAATLLNIPYHDPYHQHHHTSPVDFFSSKHQHAYYDRPPPPSQQQPSLPSPPMFVDRRQSEFPHSHSSSPSLSASQTLLEERRIEELNRKVQALELMFEAMHASNHNSNSSSNHSPLSPQSNLQPRLDSIPNSNPNLNPNVNSDQRVATSTIIAEPQACVAPSEHGSTSSSAFRYNPTPRPRVVSSTSTVVTTSSSPSTTNVSTTNNNNNGNGNDADGRTEGSGRGSKLAVVLGLKKIGGMSSTLDVSTATGAGAEAATAMATTTESRVSWSRKRTEKVAVPKTKPKVRQGPGRGRMVIRESAAN